MLDTLRAWSTGVVRDFLVSFATFAASLLTMLSWKSDPNAGTDDRWEL
jgi:hypothetical protein